MTDKTAEQLESELINSHHDRAAFAREIREHLGVYDDFNKPVAVLVRDLRAKCETQDARIAQLEAQLAEAKARALAAEQEADEAYEALAWVTDDRNLWRETEQAGNEQYNKIYEERDRLLEKVGGLGEAARRVVALVGWTLGLPEIKKPPQVKTNAAVEAVAAVRDLSKALAALPPTDHTNDQWREE